MREPLMDDVLDISLSTCSRSSRFSEPGMAEYGV